MMEKYSKSLHNVCQHTEAHSAVQYPIVDGCASTIIVKAVMSWGHGMHGVGPLTALKASRSLCFSMLTS